jgi:hypothetical protein
MFMIHTAQSMKAIIDNAVEENGGYAEPADRRTVQRFLKEHPTVEGPAMLIVQQDQEGELSINLITDPAEIDAMLESSDPFEDDESLAAQGILGSGGLDDYVYYILG